MKFEDQLIKDEMTSGDDWQKKILSRFCRL